MTNTDIKKALSCVKLCDVGWESDVRLLGAVRCSPTFFS